MIGRKRYNLVDRLISDYGRDKAKKAIVRYTSHSQAFRDCIKNAEKFIADNEYLWNN